MLKWCGVSSVECSEGWERIVLKQQLHHVVYFILAIIIAVSQSLFLSTSLSHSLTVCFSLLTWWNSSEVQPPSLGIGSEKQVPENASLYPWQKVLRVFQSVRPTVEPSRSALCTHSAEWECVFKNVTLSFWLGRKWHQRQQRERFIPFVPVYSSVEHLRAFWCASPWSWQ